MKWILCLFILPVLSSFEGSREQRHMKEVHQIEVNDAITFFRMFDLDNDHFWDEEEVRRMYHIAIDDESDRAQSILHSVYDILDGNRDGFISVDEYLVHRLPEFIDHQTSESIPSKYRV
ncbi:hypothetical protein BDB01DRAFT_801827 [Pilobolus umbonatus]|nr:hypothetical protein BDB01DRAFT_801827 [Pilobolus umbonatus]